MQVKARCDECGALPRQCTPECAEQKCRTKHEAELDAMEAAGEPPPCFHSMTGAFVTAFASPHTKKMVCVQINTVFTHLSVSEAGDLIDMLQTACAQVKERC